MKLIFKILGLLLCFHSVTHAQVTENVADINSRGNAFPFGSKIFQGEKICFQAFDRNGNTSLYILNDEGTQTIHTFTCGDHAVFINQAISYKQGVLFGVVNDSLNHGIWYWDGEGKARRIHEEAILGDEYAVVDGKLYVNASLPGKDAFVYELESGRLQKVRAFDKTIQGLGVDRMLDWKGKLMVSYLGSFYLLDKEEIQIYEPAGKGNYFEPFVFKGSLYFGFGERKQDPELKSVNILDKVSNHGNIVPNYHCVDAFAPLKGDDKVFFLSNPDGDGEAIYSMLPGSKPTRIKDKYYQETSSRFSSYCVNKDGLYFCSKPDDREEFSIWQYAMDTLIPYQLENARNPMFIAPWGQDLLMIAKHDYYDVEPLKVSTFQFPNVKVTDVVIMENTPKGRKVGQVQVDKKNSKRLKYDIVGGNIGDAFTIDPSDGSIYIQNTDSLNARLHPHIDLEVKVITSCFKPVVKVPINLLTARPIDMNNLQERFLFYPDFNRKGFLMTSVLEDGEHIGVFNEQLKMVDELVVSNKSIYFSGYPAGFYVLNAQNKHRNYFQKVEIK